MKMEEQVAPLLKDISNFKTPKRPTKATIYQSPYTASIFRTARQTPGTATASAATSTAFKRRNSFNHSAAKLKAARRLKAIEQEQEQSSRKVLVQKERSLKTLAKSLTVWLNFLFENPRSCGCEVGNGVDGVEMERSVVAIGKRGSWERGGSGGIGVDREWRNPKRTRVSDWGLEKVEEGGELINGKMFLNLRESLKAVCSFDDLLQRMRAYLSLDSCKEIFNVMTQVIKAIDEGRLRMKAHCPIATDFGMKEKATRTLLSYNPNWLRIGLHIIFGGDSLLPDGDVCTDREIGLLKMVIEKQFFTHADLAKVYAYNRKVEGLYRPGYFEALGTVVLKRFLLLVLILDRAKSQRTIPLKLGIDGIDGGSPLLFVVDNTVKSSRQMANDFLSTDVMHGEGNLLAHLEMIKFKLSYNQEPLLEYPFRVTDLFEDLQDGVRLCRAIQLLRHDSSILTRLAVPSDTQKKKLSNCSIALQYLRQANVPLHDEDGVTIMSDDVAQGDKELILSLLWNMFVHLQIPLLIKKTLFLDEISRIHGVVDDPMSISVNDPLGLLFSWVQVVGEKYGCKINSFASVADGKAMWCLLDYYFRKELDCSCPYKDTGDANAEGSIVSSSDYTNDVHNFIFSQKLTTLLGNFPEVLQISDILEHHDVRNEQSVMILLVFLSSELIVKKSMGQLNFHKLLGCTCNTWDRKRLSIEQLSAGRGNEDFVQKFKAIKEWWQDMTLQNYKRDNRRAFPFEKCGINNINPMPCLTEDEDDSILPKENAARVIQSHIRRYIARHTYMKLQRAASFLQIAICAWLAAKNKYHRSSPQTTCDRWKESEAYEKYCTFMDARHSFIQCRRTAPLIQQAVRAWISQRHQYKAIETASIIIQKHSRRWATRRKFTDMIYLLKIEADSVEHRAAERIQVTWKNYSISRCNYIKQVAASNIQCHYRGWVAKKKFLNKRQAIITIQRNFRRIRSWKAEQLKIEADEVQCGAAEKIQVAWKNYSIAKRYHNQYISASKIQCHFRRWLAEKEFLIKKQAIIKIQRNFRGVRSWKAEQLNVTVRAITIIQSRVRTWLARREFCRHRQLIAVIQSHVRRWLATREFLHERESSVKIQTVWRGHKLRVQFGLYKQASIKIQSLARGQICRKRLLGSTCQIKTCNSSIFDSLSFPSRSFELRVVLASIVKLQRWWRDTLPRTLKKYQATVIQSHTRGWLARRQVSNERSQIVVIQSHWRGYLARKESKQNLIDLRKRMLESAKNIDDSKRLMNRLLAALAELLGMKSVRGILHTCETLDMATKHSQKCCEELVAAGAIKTLLKLIPSVSQSIPDQQILKYALSTLRNLSRYPHLITSVISTKRSVEIIFWEMLRSKDDAYFIAAELMKKICSVSEGAEAVGRQTSLMKRLHAHIEDLKRKISNEKRSKPRANSTAKENMERRLQEASELLKLATTATST